MTDEDFVPMNPDHWVEPGTESFAVQYSAAESLALSAVAAEMECDAIRAGRLLGDSTEDGHDEDLAFDRSIDAQNALMLEIEALHLSSRAEEPAL